MLAGSGVGIKAIRQPVAVQRRRLAAVRQYGYFGGSGHGRNRIVDSRRRRNRSSSGRQRRRRKGRSCRGPDCCSGRHRDVLRTHDVTAVTATFEVRIVKFPVGTCLQRVCKRLDG